MMGGFPEVLNFKQLILKLNRYACKYNPDVSQSNHLHVVIFRYFFIKLRYIP